MKRYVPWILTVLSMAAALYFFALLIDAGISLDGARTRNSQLQERGKVSLDILKQGWIGQSRTKLLTATKGMERNDVIVKNSSEIVEVGDIVFSISNEKIVDVRYMD